MYSEMRRRKGERERVKRRRRERERGQVEDRLNAFTINKLYAAPWHR